MFQSLLVVIRSLVDAIDGDGNPLLNPLEIMSILEDMVTNDLNQRHASDRTDLHTEVLKVIQERVDHYETLAEEIASNPMMHEVRKQNSRKYADRWRRLWFEWDEHMRFLLHHNGE